VASLYVDDAERGSRVEELWRAYLELYQVYSSPTYTSQGVKHSPHEFAFKAQQWLRNFTAPASGDPDQATYRKGMYSDTSVTPYIHGMVAHLPNMMIQLAMHDFTLSLFSCHSLEKKNHSQSSDVFQTTLRGGCEHSVYRSLLERELVLFFFHHDCIQDSC
jgi:hypothetical protein